MRASVLVHWIPMPISAGAAGCWSVLIMPALILSSQRLPLFWLLGATGFVSLDIYLSLSSLFLYDSLPCSEPTTPLNDNVGGARDAISSSIASPVNIGIATPNSRASSLASVRHALPIKTTPYLSSTLNGVLKFVSRVSMAALIRSWAAMPTICRGHVLRRDRIGLLQS